MVSAGIGGCAASAAPPAPPGTAEQLQLDAAKAVAAVRSCPLPSETCLRMLPAGLSADGLPVGLALDGPLGSDERLIAIGIAFEAVPGPLPARRR